MGEQVGRKLQIKTYLKDLVFIFVCFYQYSVTLLLAILKNYIEMILVNNIVFLKYTIL